jgi:tetratricopeptide (TPR) repeat protein
VLAALASRPDIPAARLAHHASGAHDASQVLRYASLAAAEAAAVGAHREAASHYELALRHGESLAPEERARLQELLAVECNLTGQHERAIEIECQALQFWRSSGSRLKEGRALRALSWMSWCAGDLTAALQYAKDAVAVLQGLPPGADLALAFCMMADQDMEWHETESAINWARRALAIAEPLGNSSIMSDALNALAGARWRVGCATGQRLHGFGGNGGVPTGVCRGSSIYRTRACALSRARSGCHVVVPDCLPRANAIRAGGLERCR